VAERSVVISLPAHQVAVVIEVRNTNMGKIDLSPKYSTSEISGKCVKCLAEQELNNCIFQLLSTGGEDENLQQKFNALVDFLRSPEARTLVDEAEKLLSEGKQVSVSIHYEGDRVNYKINTEETNKEVSN
jgi:hypothetical protein